MRKLKTNMRYLMQLRQSPSMVVPRAEASPCPWERAEQNTTLKKEKARHLMNPAKCSQYSHSPALWISIQMKLPGKEHCVETCSHFNEFCHSNMQYKRTQTRTQAWQFIWYNLSWKSLYYPLGRAAEAIVSEQSLSNYKLGLHDVNPAWHNSCHHTLTANVILKCSFTVRWPDSLSALPVARQMGSLGFSETRRAVYLRAF